MLQNGSDVAASENVSGKKQYREPVDGCSRSPSQHVGSAWPNRGRAYQRAEAVAHLGECSGGVDHRLLITAQVVGKVRILLERLTNARDVAVSEDAEAPGEESALVTVARYELGFQELNDGLRRGQPSRHVSTPVSVVQ